MKKKILVLLLHIQSFGVWSQLVTYLSVEGGKTTEDKAAVKQEISRSDSGYVIRQYTIPENILESELVTNTPYPSVINGTKTSFYRTGLISKKGSYKRNIPVGDWFENYRNGNTKFKYYVDSVVNYPNIPQKVSLTPKAKYTYIGDSTGKQVIQNGTGLLSTNRKDYFFKDSLLIYEINNGKEIYYSVDSLPSCPNFWNLLKAFLSYPKEARNEQVSGQVILTFDVLLSGQVSNIEVVKSLGKSCDEAAIRAINKTSGEWIPAYLNNEQVSCKVMRSIQFGNR